MALYSVVAPKNKLAERKRLLIPCQLFWNITFGCRFLWLSVSPWWRKRLPLSVPYRIIGFNSYRSFWYKVARYKFTQLRRKYFKVLDLKEQRLSPKMFCLFTRKLLFKVKEIFVQFHRLSSSRNDLYWNNWFPGSTYRLCLWSFLHPIKSG